MNKIQIKRSKGFIGGQITGAIISLVFLFISIFCMIINGFHIGFLFLSIIFLGCFIISFYFVVKMLGNPKIILEFDEYALYYNLKKGQITIPYHEIKEIKAVNERNKYNELLCGWVYVTKKDNTLYKIGVINDVKNVHLQIKEIIEKIGKDQYLF